MKIEIGDKVRLIHNSPEPGLGLKPGLEGTYTGEIDNFQNAIWRRVKWSNGDKWYVPENQIKVIKS